MKKNQILSLILVGTLLFGVTSATSSYIHEQNGTISICNPTSNGESCITMKNMNEGATQPGVGCINYANNCWTREYFGDTFESKEDCNSRGQGLYEACMETHSGEYGKHYQWGNNHGFLPCLDSNGCETFPGNEDMITNERVDTTDYGPQNYFDRAVFSKITSSPYDWSTTRNDNLRGGANDSQANNRGYDETNNVATNVTGRQGPCGEGYHVPSIGEWNQVLKYWAEENGIDLYGEDEEGLLYNDDGDQNFMQFQEDFKIPFAGYRNDSAKVYGIGDYAHLWSSSPRAGDVLARGFGLSPLEAYAYNNSLRADAFSVRCFKNSYLSFPSSEGGGSGGNSEIIVNIGKFNNGQNTCTGQDFIFSGIFASPTTVTRNLVKTFQCAFGNMGAKAVTLQLQGDLTDGSGNVISSGNVRIKNRAWVGTPAGVKGNAVSTDSYTSLSNTITLFNKAANIIGIAEGTGVDIQIEIPGGTPNGTYNGVLILSY